MKKVISTPHAPAAIGPYSQAIDTGDLIFISGQIPIIPETGKLLEGDIKLQTGQVMRNIGAILSAAGLDFGHVVKCTCYLEDIADFKEMNEVYGSFFTSEPPARAALQIGKLPLGAKVEVDTIAVRKK
ncbi:MAG: RidA family protein [Bacteroidales bacterium]|jgi:2-iminobutanoate/2-iminopropanoate deaminase